MSQKIVECVPNFSEGKDKTKIKQITDVIEMIPGVTLLGVEMGADTNRTVVTFVGTPDGVSEAAFRAIEKAAQVIDMSTHRGAHPRMGATDVCPFVPVEGVSMQDCVEIAKTVGERVGRELNIPVYLYEEAATNGKRKNLADIRKGEYEALPKKLLQPEWKPDFGPARFNTRAGATVIGAREFLIAYNITLNSTDKQHASDIAFEIRESGRVARRGNTSPYYYRGKQLLYKDGVYPCGSCQFDGKSYDEVRRHCKNEHGYDLDKLLGANSVDTANVIGKKVYKPGKFQYCKAIGWYVDEFKRCQISINLTNFKVTPPHIVLEEARRLANDRGLAITGSEIVGLVPYKAILDSGKYYLKKQAKTIGVPNIDILRTAVFSMGLDDVTPFEIEKKVLGIPLTNPKALVSMSVTDFTSEVSRDTPAPGGGSIAALAGALSAALASMVSNLTFGKEGTEARDEVLFQIAETAQSLKNQLIMAVDEDRNAFNAFMEARRLPQNTNEEKAFRERKMQEGLKQAVLVPLKTAELSYEAMQMARKAINVGNPNCLSDGAVGVQIGYVGVRGGVWNVLINLNDITDRNFIDEMKHKSDELIDRAKELANEAGNLVDEKLTGNQ